MGINSFILFQCQPCFYFTTTSIPSLPCQVLHHQLHLQLMEDYLLNWCLILIRAISYPTPSAEMPPPPSIIHRPDATGTIHPGNAFHVRSRASSASTTHRVTPASSINPQQASSSAHPDIRSSKRQRVATMMETPVRCREATVDPSPHNSPSKSIPPTANPAATVRSSTAEKRPAPTPPGDRVDALNRPWPPCDDQELVNYKRDTKARPSLDKECVVQLKAVVLVGSG